MDNEQAQREVKNLIFAIVGWHFGLDKLQTLRVYCDQRAENCDYLLEYKGKQVRLEDFKAPSHALEFGPLYKAIKELISKAA